MIEYKLPTTHTKYYVNDKIVPSVTTVLSILGSKNLVQWANRLGFRHINSDQATIRSAKVGTLAHLLIEHHIKGDINEFNMDKFISANPEYDDSMIDEAVISYEAFERFESKYKGRIRYIWSEKELVSEKYGYGGTIDIYLVLDDTRYMIWDLKTSNYFSRKMFFQTAAYKQMVEETGREVDELVIVKLPKVEGEEIKIKRSKDTQKYFKTFLSILNTYKLINSYFNDGLSF